MLKKLALAAALLPAVAFAQAAPTQPDPQAQALSQTVLELTGQGVQLRSQVIALQAEVKRLNDELAAAKAPKADPTPAK